MNTKSKMNKELIIVMDDEPIMMTEENKFHFNGTPFQEFYESHTAKELSEIVLFANSSDFVIVVVPKSKVVK